VRWLPCDTCTAQASTVQSKKVEGPERPWNIVNPEQSRPIVAATLKTGEAYAIGRAPHKFPLRVYCTRCRRVTYVTATQWNRLPRVPSPPTPTDSESNSESSTTT